MAFNGYATREEGIVGAGMDSILCQDGRLIAYASDVNYRSNYELEGIRTLGFSGNRDFKSLGYTGDADIGTFLLRKAPQDADGYLATSGWQSDGSNNINTAGYFDFAILDLNTKEVLVTLIGAKLDSENTSFPSKGLNEKKTTWKVMRIIPGLQAA